MSIVMILHEYHVNVGHTLLIIGDSMLLQYGCTNFIIVLIQYCIHVAFFGIYVVMIFSKHRICIACALLNVRDAMLQFNITTN
jgi:hypothetical protein